MMKKVAATVALHQVGFILGSVLANSNRVRAGLSFRRQKADFPVSRMHGLARSICSLVLMGVDR